MNKEAVIRDVVTMLRRHYGLRLDRVILYGSYARGDFHDESDVDFLAVLNGDVAHGEEISALSRFVSELTDKHGVWISVKPVALAQLEAGKLLFYRTIKREGIPLYERRAHAVH